MFFNLFATFFKIGAFTFGGGYAMLPIIQRELVETKELISEEEYMDAIALAQASPGSVALNTSIYVGYRIKGFGGAVASALGSILPSFIIILLIAVYFFRFRNNAFVDSIFMGIRPAIVALILSAVYKMWINSRKTYIKLFSSIATVLLVVFTGLNPIWIIVIGALSSVIYHRLYWPFEENKER
ncbi:chromate transporter [Gudongella sp. DL1XJH-153]|uniref:chromate transporter n=1 Tax=Gudongella sp. DL1XJH-153 TaxID=3409804 RepID=UPI003BB70A5B